MTGRSLANTVLAQPQTWPAVSRKGLRGLSAHHLASIVRAADDGIISKDLNGIVTSWNPAAERIFGYPAEEMIGQPILRLIPPYLAWEEEMILNSIRNGEQVRHYEEQRLTKANVLITIALTVSPIHDDHGNVVGASKIVRDISADKELERALERMKDQLLSDVSHELRTPLTGIRAALRLLQNGRLPAAESRGASLLRIANDNADRLLRLVDELLDFQRLHAGTSVHRRTCFIAEIVPPAIESISPVADLQGIKLLSSSDVADDLALYGDPDRLQQVLLNLLSNALKYSTPEKTVEVAVSSEAGHLLIRVRDEGRGIPSSSLEKIFERFEQVEKTDARREGGVGLGLAISRKIVQQHGGTIWAERNDTGVPGLPGSTFALRLPLPSSAVVHEVPSSQSFLGQNEHAQTLP